VQLPTGYNVGNIDIQSVRLQGIVPPEMDPKYGFVKNLASAGGEDGEAMREVVFRFDREAVAAVLPVGDSVTVNLTGTVAGVQFKGSDTIKVIKNDGTKQPNDNRQRPSGNQTGQGNSNQGNSNQTGQGSSNQGNSNQTGQGTPIKATASDRPGELQSRQRQSDRPGNSIKAMAIKLARELQSRQWQSSWPGEL